MTALAMRARPHGSGGTLLVGDAGHFALAPDGLVDRLASGVEAEEDVAALVDAGLAVRAGDPLGWAAHLHGVAMRRDAGGPLDYLILVPTLRCNLGCSYCQVSRVAEGRPGFDWSEETLGHVLALIDGLPGDRIKIEFQGGEPTLRPDLIRAVIGRAERFAERQFVICTNLQRLDDEIWSILEREDVCVSTSLDGDADVHSRQRTGGDLETARYFGNLDRVMARLGPERVSALPTVDPRSPPGSSTPTRPRG